MSFQVDDRVVHPSYGFGRIIGLVTKRFFETGTHLYYEIAIQQGTVWTRIGSDAANELRLLTSKDELEYYRQVLRSRPEPLNPDARQRRLEILDRLKSGSFQVMCEVVRDLTAQGRQKALRDMDATLLKKVRQGLCQEWAAAENISIPQATQEIDGLLQNSSQD